MRVALVTLDRRCELARELQVLVSGADRAISTVMIDMKISSSGREHMHRILIHSRKLLMPVHTRARLLVRLCSMPIVRDHRNNLLGLASSANIAIAGSVPGRLDHVAV